MAPRGGLDGINLVAHTAQTPATRLVESPKPRARKQYVIRVTDLFLYAFLSICVYVLIAPLTPLVTYGMAALNPEVPTPAPLPSITNPRSTPAISSVVQPKTVLANVVQQKNHLTVSKIGVDADIIEGATEDALNQGVWRIPTSSTPDKGGNTVLAAHRFMYLSGPKTFYNLDKLAIGDQFTIRWNNVDYTYEVATTETVTSDATWIEAPTTDPVVTLFTCTPLWTSKNRLVVRAKLVPN